MPKPNPKLNPLPSTRYQQLSLSGHVAPDPSQLQALTQLDRLHHQLHSSTHDDGLMRQLRQRIFKPKPDAIKGCYLCGGVGTGKTMLMDIFYQSLNENSVLRTHFHRFMADIHHKKRSLKHQQNPLAIIARNLAQSYRVICLDEFTISDITDAMLMASLLQGLFAQHCVLVTTSNTLISELYKGGLQRSRFLPAIQLLQKNMLTIQVDHGNDYRQEFLQDAGIYHYPADAAAIKRVGAVFRQLSGQTDSVAVSMTDSAAHKIAINGREIAVVAVGSGVVWFDFNAIARTARSNLDFIEIARQFHSVIISNIPALGNNDNDAVRRLIELVDELYDRNVKLIVSSNARAETLYSGKRLAKPFQRTASRLVEMSSKEYLNRPHQS